MAALFVGPISGQRAQFPKTSAILHTNQATITSSYFKSFP